MLTSATVLPSITLRFVNVWLLNWKPDFLPLESYIAFTSTLKGIILPSGWFIIDWKSTVWLFVGGTLVKICILGFALCEAMALFALMMAFLILYG